MKQLHRWLLSSIATAALVSHAVAQSPTYFRGDRGLVADDVRTLPDRFDSADALVWRQPLAPGHSTPCIAGDAIYLTTFEDGKLATVALDRATGKVRWTKQLPAERIEEFHPTGSPAASTPACDGQRVFVMFGSYGLVCYDLAGNVVWTKPMGPFQDEFGSASSPVLVDGKLLLAEDHDLNNFLLCVDAATGKTLWQTPREGFTRSYSTPIVWDSAAQSVPANPSPPAPLPASGARGAERNAASPRSTSKKQVIVAGALQLVSYDLESGKPLWTVDGLARIVNTTPVADGGLVFVATWSPGGDAGQRIAMEPWAEALKKYDKNGDGKLTREECDNKEVLDRFYRIDLNQDTFLDEVEWNKYARVFDLAKNAILAIRPGELVAGSKSADSGAAGGSRRTEPKVVWQYDRGIPYVPSPLVYRGVVYLMKEGGILTTLDAATGKVLKAARVAGTGNYYSSPVAGDGKVFTVSERGVLSVLRAAGDWEPISSHDLGERTVATPVIHAGRVYVRTESALYCFEKR